MSRTQPCGRAAAARTLDSNAGGGPASPTYSLSPIGYFESGLLARLVRYAASPLGLVPSRIDYGDYREVDGVKIPFQWTVAQPNESVTTQLEQVRENVPIDDTRFAMPAPPAASPKPVGP